MKNGWKFWLATALAPLSVPALFFLWQIWRVGHIYFDYVTLYTIFSYGGMLLFGLPYALILRSMDKLSFATLLVGGLFLGTLYVVLVAEFIFDANVNFGDLYSSDLAIYILLSVVVAAVFGLIARIRIY